MSLPDISQILHILYFIYKTGKNASTFPCLSRTPKRRRSSPDGADTYKQAARVCKSAHVRAGGAGSILFEKHLSSPAKSKNASVLFVPDSRSSHTFGHKKYSIFDFSVGLRMFFFRRWMPCCRLQTERAGRLFCCPPSEFHALPCQYAKLVRVPHALHFRDIICSLKHP